MNLDDTGGLSLRDLVIELRGELRGYVAAHEQRHGQLVPPDVLTLRHQETTEDLRQLTQDVRSLAATVATLVPVVGDVAQLDGTVTAHERTIQRMVGAMIFVSVLGLGTLLLGLGTLVWTIVTTAGSV